MSEPRLKKLKSNSDKPFIRKRVRRRIESDEETSDTGKNDTTTDFLPPEKERILRNLIIELRHDVPPQHQVEKSAGSRAPSAQEKEEFKEHEPCLKRGSFSREEDEKILENWSAFCEIHCWDPSNPEPFLFHRHKYHYYIPKIEERKKFVQFLADGLPQRSLYSVYHRFRNLFDPHKVDKYKQDEDFYIIEQIENNKNVDDSRKFADLAKTLNRTRASVWRRYRLLKRKRNSEDSD